MHKMASMHKMELTDYTPTLVEQAFGRLRGDVLAGTFAAGAKLKLEDRTQAALFAVQRGWVRPQRDSAR